MALCSYHHCMVNDWKIWRCKYFILINFLAEKILWNLFSWNSFLQFYFEITKINSNLLPSYESIPKRQLISWLRRNKAEETFKVGQWSSKKNCYICFNERLLKMMKSTFYFIFKALLVLKTFKFLSWLFGHVEKLHD